MDQSPWMVKRWSLVVTIPTLEVPTGEITFLIDSNDHNFFQRS